MLILCRRNCFLNTLLIMDNERQNEPKRTELGTQIKIIISISFNVSATDKLSFSTFVALATRRISNILRGKYKKNKSTLVARKRAC